MPNPNQSELTLQAMQAAEEAISALRSQVDPGHIPMKHYLTDLKLRLRREREGLAKRMEHESGG
jgi:hypothetical protein